MSNKTCSRCGSTKEVDLFIKNRNICKECNNTRRRELILIKYQTTPDTTEVTCSKCNTTKIIKLFIKDTKICKDCNNHKRRERYKNDEEHQQNQKERGRMYKKKKTEERRMKKLMEIGVGNKKCNYCNEIKPEDKFRHNRLKCKNCEKDDPKEKIKRVIRTRIYSALHSKKDKHTIHYLGCCNSDYIKWITYNDLNYTLENHGKEWHIDHVIPLSKFNLYDEDEQVIAFNWRNTTTISVKHNLQKNNKILKPQIQEHFEKLKKYHENNNIEMPQLYIDLFAKYLVAGTPLEPLLPLTNRNVSEELG